MVTRPHGHDALVAMFGDPLPFVNRKDFWEKQILQTVLLPTPLIYAYDLSTLITRVRAHHLIANHLADTLMAVLDAGVPRERFKYGGTYCWRAMRTNPSQLSLHTWGVAVDPEPVENPLGEPWVDDGKRLDPRIIEVFKARGWFWGGDFHGMKDPQHWQWASGV